MKALNCKISVILLLLASSSLSMYAQEIKKTMHKEFKTNNSTVLSMETKFCELTIESWDKNLASFDVTIIAETENPEKAQKMLDLMSVEFYQDGNEISVETKIGDKKNKMDLGKNNKMKIVILAKVPAGIGFELKNNFGNVEITDLSGNVSIENNFGSVAVHSLTGKTIELALNYGKVRISQLANAQIELNYGDLTISEAKNLELDMNFGHCTIKKALDVTAEVNMGDLTIEEVGADFKVLDIKSNTGNVEIGINKAAGFTLKGEVSMGGLYLPDLDQMENNKNGMNKKVRGVYGNGKSVVSLESNLGDITINIK